MVVRWTSDERVMNGGYWEEKDGADGGAAGGIRHTNALYKRNE